MLKTTHFERTYKGEKQYIFQYDKIRVILSNPIITPFHDVCNGEHDILYYYYNIEIQKLDYKRLKLRNGKIKEKLMWQTVQSNYVNEYGSLQILQRCIKEILDLDLSKKRKNREYLYYNINNKIELSKDFIVNHYTDIHGMLREDTFFIHKVFKHLDSTYDLKKEKYVSEDIEYYNVTFKCGGTELINYDVGVSVYNLSREDMTILYEWAKNFLDISIKQCQEYMKK